MGARIRHQLGDDGRVLVTMTAAAGWAGFVHLEPEEIKRFCWAVLSDLDPDGAEESMGLAGDETQVAHQIKRFLDVDPMSAKILQCMLRSPGAVLRREQLQELCGCTGDPKTVDVYIHRLRRGMRKHNLNPMSIESVWGVGYGVMHADAVKLRGAMGLA